VCVNTTFSIPAWTLNNKRQSLSVDLDTARKSLGGKTFRMKLDLLLQRHLRLFHNTRMIHLQRSCCSYNPASRNQLSMFKTEVQTFKVKKEFSKGLPVRQHKFQML
jgi:hypothetical protein